MKDEPPAIQVQHAFHRLSRHSAWAPHERKPSLGSPWPSKQLALVRALQVKPNAVETQQLAGDLARTADAARGAATKRGGWRSSGTLSCQSKPVVDEPVSVRASLASLSTPTTCKLRGRTTSAAFCAAHETHLAGVTDGAGA